MWKGDFSPARLTAPGWIVVAVVVAASAAARSRPQPPAAPAAAPIIVNPRSSLSRHSQILE